MGQFDDYFATQFNSIQVLVWVGLESASWLGTPPKEEARRMNS
jgi:hypothetical protein